MKLFNFTCNSFGPTWFVCAETREDAIAACRKQIENNFHKECEEERREAREFKGAPDFSNAIDHKEYQEKHLIACVKGIAQYNGGTKHSIDEIEPGVVVMSEES